MTAILSPGISHDHRNYHSHIYKKLNSEHGSCASLLELLVIVSVLSDPLLTVAGMSSSEMTQDERDEDGAEPGHGTG